jgi:spermidine synthase
VIIYLLSIGLVSILAQVVILRELAVAFFGVELIYILSIAVWLLWTALGAVVGRRSRTPSAATIGHLFVLLAFLLPADVAFIRMLRIISGGVPGAYLPFGVQILGLLTALLPVGIVLGLLFQSTARAYIGQKRTLAGAYAIESAGGMMGGLASTLLLAVGVQNFMIAVLCGALTVVTVLAAGGWASESARPLKPLGKPAAPAVSASRRRGSAGARPAALVAVPIILLLAFAAPRLDLALTRANHPALVATRDSPYGRITVTRHGEQSIVFENDVLAFETQNVTAEEFVHVAATHADSLHRILVLGGGVEGFVSECLKYAPSRLDYVELNSVLLSLVEEYLPRSQWEAIGSPPVNLVIADPRRFIQRTTSRYDLVLVGMPDPTSGQTNRFYTREFFSLCADALAPRGVLALRLRSSENIWTPFLSYRNASIAEALSQAFGDIVVLPGATNIVVASNDPFSRDPVRLGDRLEERDVATRLVTPAYLAYLYTNDRFFEIAENLSNTNVPPNTDARPVSFKYSSMIWLSKFFPRLIAAEMGSSASSAARPLGGLIAALALFCAVFLLVRRRTGSRRVLLAMLAGFIGMVVETQLILYYQVKSGVLYQNLGVLLMVFMAGLAVGAAALPLLARREHGGGARHQKAWGWGLFLAFTLVNLVFVRLLRLGAGAELLSVSCLLFVAAVLVSGVFAYASLLGTGDQRALVAPLYAADLIGGCAGSMLGGLLLVPFLGLGATAWAMVILSLAALLVV